MKKLGKIQVHDDEQQEMKKKKSGNKSKWKHKLMQRGTISKTPTTRPIKETMLAEHN